MKQEERQVKYLYGAAVQGIQEFIFQTNKLKEIIGASDLVEQVCTTIFYELLIKAKNEIEGTNYALNNQDNTKNQYKPEEDPNFIVHAAGNIKYIFTNEKVCKYVVKEFPMRVREAAPGITISQAVEDMSAIKLSNNEEVSKAIDNLEEKLKAQRNKPTRNLTYGMMGILRARETGLPVIEKRVIYNKKTNEKEEQFLDIATIKKLYVDINEKEKEKEKERDGKELGKKAFGEDEKRDSAKDIEDMIKENSWIAIIHADGNGLGRVIQQIGKDLIKFKHFSELLDKATIIAAQTAYNNLLSERYERFGLNKNKINIIPIRPIVLSGDDFTVICRADFALDYTNEFLTEFEKQTNALLTNAKIKNENQCNLLEGVFTTGDIKDKLTACAGIAFIKASYPFYYGYSLAEKLCDVAKKCAKDTDNKKIGKELPASCVMFHKVQDSFVEDYKTIKERELTLKDGKSLSFGPYYIGKQEYNGNSIPADKWTIETLNRYVNEIDSDEGSIKSTLKKWLSALYNNPALAQQTRKRFLGLAKEKSKTTAKILRVATECYNDKKYPTYDILTINTVLTQKTR